MFNLTKGKWFMNSRNVRRMRLIVLSLNFFFPAILLLVMCGELVLQYPCNHGGGLRGYLPVILTFLMMNLSCRIWLKASCKAICVSLMCLLVLCLSDCFNLYVHYDVWLRRGMPNFGSFCLQKGDGGMNR